jgi:predicted transcriptional regulator
MEMSELFEKLKKLKNLKTDIELAELLGYTPAWVSQLHNKKENVTPSSLAKYIIKAIASAEKRGRKQVPVNQMKDFIDGLKKDKSAKDKDIAELFGCTPARVSQLSNEELKVNNLVRYFLSAIKKTRENSLEHAFDNPIRSVVEMYPIKAVLSKQNKKWEILQTDKHPKNQAIRKHLENVTGLYIFFDSQLCPIYVGKTEKQSIWKEMNDAFNRRRQNYQVFRVDHHDTNFSPAHEKIIQPKLEVVYLYETASYFSAYDITPKLIPRLEALLIRVFCNILSNKKNEKFEKKTSSRKTAKPEPTHG